MPRSRSRPKRLWHHLWSGAGSIKSCFGAQGFERIEAAIAASETRHGAEIRFAVEASLDAASLWRRVTARERAHGHFSQLRVWDTDQNNGILIYVLLADHAVEILADREALRRVPQAVWDQACATMTQAFAGGDFSGGVVAAIGQLSPALEAAFPRGTSDRDELPNQVSVL